MRVLILATYLTSEELPGLAFVTFALQISEQQRRNTICAWYCQKRSRVRLPPTEYIDIENLASEVELRLAQKNLLSRSHAVKISRMRLRVGRPRPAAKSRRTDARQMSVSKPSRGQS